MSAIAVVVANLGSGETLESLKFEDRPADATFSGPLVAVHPDDHAPAAARGRAGR
jgi:hypothetical protein